MQPIKEPSNRIAASVSNQCILDLVPIKVINWNLLEAICCFICLLAPCSLLQLLLLLLGSGWPKHEGSRQWIATAIQGDRWRVRAALTSVEINLLLLEVAPVLLIHQDEIQKVFDAEAVVHVFHGGGKIVGRQEKTDGDDLATSRRPVHDLKFGHRIALGSSSGAGAHGFSPLDLQLHVLDLHANQQEVDAANHRILKVKVGRIVLKLDVQAVLNSHFHLP